LRNFILRTLFALAITANGVLGFQSLASASDAYEGIPRGYDFPADENRLLAYLDHNDVHAMRRHAWRVFEGLTTKSALGHGIPKWQTWYDVDDAFPSGHAGGVSRTMKLRDLEVPEELKDIQRPLPAGPVAAPPAPDNALATLLGQLILYNREAYCQIRACGLYLKKHLDELKAQGRTIDFPRTAIALKTSWVYVSQTGCTPIPVWNFRRLASGLVINFQGRWPDPPVSVCPEAGPSDPFSKLYSVPILPEELAQVRNVAGFDKANAGDYAVLVGFHFATRELQNWVWATFWWHNLPDDGPWADDRPKTLKGVWRNYLMSVSYDMDRPREADGKPHIAYNPYLEGQFPDGVTSNCMTCHRRATWPLSGRVNTLLTDNERQSLSFPNIVVRGSDAAVNTYFNVPYDKLLKTSFLWSLVFHSKPQDADPNPPVPAGCECQCATPPN
jgi:hypothetical protein